MATSGSGGPSASTGASTYDPSKDPTRKAKSKDPGWKYGYLPDLNDKNLVRCTLCGKDAKGGIKRLKQHLIGGYGDISKCPKTIAAIAREMHEAIMRNQKRKPYVFDEDYSVDHQQGEDLLEEIESGGQLQSVKGPIDSYLRRTPEEIVGERRSKGSTQTTIQSSLRSNADREKTNAYVAKWFYKTGIPFKTVKLRSFEEMVEAIAQFGSGYKPPSYHELRVPLLQDEKAQIDYIKKKYEDYWKMHGCTLMYDGWTDKRGRHLINFLVNCPLGTYFMGSVDVSSESQYADMLFQLLDSKIEEIGEDNVVQVVTDNAANYVAAAHCLDLMLEDIGKLKAYKTTIERAKTMTSFIYRHYKLVDALRKKTNGIDLVRSGVKRFATSFLTLQSLYKNKDALKQLFVFDDWNSSKLSKTEAGKKVLETILAQTFWNSVLDCLRASQPILVVLRGRATIEESSDDEVEEEVDDVVRDDEDIEEDFGDGPTDSMSQQQQEGEEVFLILPRGSNIKISWFMDSWSMMDFVDLVLGIIEVPFGYSRKDVLLIGVGVTVLGIGLKSGLEFVGVDPLQAGNVVQLVLVLGLTIGWISTYIFRVSNKEMTYAQQLRDYENKVMQKRLEGLTEAELEALLEQVEEEKNRLASGEKLN
ncbi:uncharacterized protein LOC122078124 [Macadamia integrifolia]|uniref:uncharacterized protein LOC122078124 n=1 Tax=Macadamia integrifolia TaxID=60698 RepID=UPI001C4FF23F|nr:uncharacterized protein LOC122078124 [Macadamia integrifolia]